MRKNLFNLRLLPVYVHRVSLWLIQTLLYQPKPLVEEVKTCLVFRHKHLGDLLLALPVLWSMKTQNPDIKMTLVTGTWNRGLAEICKDLFVKVIYYNSRRFSRAPGEKMTVKKRFRIWKNLMNQQFDLCIDFDGVASFFSMYIFKRVEHLATIEALRFRQNLADIGVAGSPFKYHTHDRGERENLTAVLQILEWNDKSSDFDFKDFFTIRHTMVNNTQKLGIHPGAADQAKGFSPDFWSDLIAGLSEKFPDINIRLYGTESEKSMLYKITSGSDVKVDVLVDDSMYVFFQNFTQNSLIIGLDSFSQHVAFLAGIPSIIIYRHDNRNRWAAQDPELHKSLLIEKGVNSRESINRFWQQVPDSFFQRFLCR